MADSNLHDVRRLIAECSPGEQESLFRELRARHIIHEYERVVGAPAEMILDAIHRAPELTRRMLRGVIADAAFGAFIVPKLEPQGWRDVTPEGNFAFDYMVEDDRGSITVQVKLQRSERGGPLVRQGKRYGFDGKVFVVETQKTRTGEDGGEKTRPYRYGEFEILAVSMQPSATRWDRFMYTLGRWLIPSNRPGEIATYQPVAMDPNDYWTTDFATAAEWLRASDGGKRMALAPRAPKVKASRRPRRRRDPATLELL